jgi:hypothetical protein
MSGVEVRRRTPSLPRERGLRAVRRGMALRLVHGFEPAVAYQETSG